MSSELENLKQKENLFRNLENTLSKIAQLNVKDLSFEEETILKWNGLYLQRPRDAGKFMLRIRMPGGRIYNHQLGKLLEIMSLMDIDYIDITTRQDIQLRNIKLSMLPEIFELLDQVKLNTQGACGDTVRNIVSCPVEDLVDKCDGSHNLIYKTLIDKFTSNYKFAQLPRKFKIAYSGCKNSCIPLMIHDIGIAQINYGANELFDIYAGGGLSANPVAGKKIFRLLNVDEVLEAITAIIEVFNAYGNRNNRNKARLKYLISDWGMKKFTGKVSEKLGYELNKAEHERCIPVKRQDHMGIQEQNQHGYCYAGVPVLAGRLYKFQIESILNILKNNNSTNIRFSYFQNLIIPDIPTDKLNSSLNILKQNDLELNPSSWKGKFVVCTGKEFCNKALAETKNVTIQLIKDLKENGIDKNLLIAMSGCPNGCSQHLIADIGIYGGLKNIDGKNIEVYNICCRNNNSDNNSYFNQTIIKNTPKEVLSEVLIKAIKNY